MISSVFICGRVGKIIDKHFRYVNVRRPLVDMEGKYQIDEIPVRASYFACENWLKEKENSFIVLKGRIEKDKKIGLVIVIEHKEIYSPDLQNKKYLFAKDEKNNVKSS